MCTPFRLLFMLFPVRFLFHEWCWCLLVLTGISAFFQPLSGNNNTTTTFGSNPQGVLDVGASERVGSQSNPSCINSRQNDGHDSEKDGGLFGRKLIHCSPVWQKDHVHQTGKKRNCVTECCRGRLVSCLSSFALACMIKCNCRLSIRWSRIQSFGRVKPVESTISILSWYYQLHYERMSGEFQRKSGFGYRVNTFTWFSCVVW